MENKKKNKNHLLLISIAIIIPVLFSISYAYFLASIKGNNTDINGSASTTFDISLDTANDGYISASNLIPISSDKISEKASKGIFSVKTGGNNHKISYSLYLESISISSSLKSTDFKWELLNKDSGSVINNGDFSEVNGIMKILSDKEINPNSSDNYLFRVYILATDNDQSSMINSSFSGKIKITADMVY